MTRYVHFEDWGSDVCPNFPETPPPGHFYPPNTKKGHLLENQPTDGYPSGDRAKYMTCKNCGAVIWGFSNIEEHPF